MNASSFSDLLQRDHVTRVEVPIIQRDYAQGRHNAEATRIRDAFLGVLHGALIGGGPVHLDFVYGHIEDGKLVPLDGQQRLTALFLLHWYLGARADVADGAANRLPKLTTRPGGARVGFVSCSSHSGHFHCRSDLDVSDWLRNQSWFASAWRHDPTIASMLVVLDAIHERFATADCLTAWQRLVDPDGPAITFDFLPIEKLGLTEDLYIKMNSRGKPLTSFENLKAEFEGMVREISESRYGELCSKIDNQWTDVFWKLRGSEKVIDDLFLRYFRFVTDALGYWHKGDVQGNDLDRARSVYAGSEANLGFLFDAFDMWHGKNVRAWFERVFTKTTHEPGKVAIFDDVDLLRACCNSYADTRSVPIATSPCESCSCSLPLFSICGGAAPTSAADPRSPELGSELRERGAPGRAAYNAGGGLPACGNWKPTGSWIQPSSGRRRRSKDRHPRRATRNCRSRSGDSKIIPCCKGASRRSSSTRTTLSDALRHSKGLPAGNRAAIAGREGGVACMRRLFSAELDGTISVRHREAGGLA